MHPLKEAIRTETRRQFFGQAATGLGGLALSNLLSTDAFALPQSSGVGGGLPSLPHFAPRAKRCIYLHMMGAPPQMDLLDYKPQMKDWYNKDLPESIRQGQRLTTMTSGQSRFPVAPSVFNFAQHGHVGAWFSDFLPHTASMADDLAVVRSMWTTDNNHGAQIQFHTGRHMLEGDFPSIGSWVHYGLGTLNENLPQFVVFGNTLGNNVEAAHCADYLGPEHAGVRLQVDPKNPLPFASPGPEVYREEQQGEFELLRDLNGLVEVEYPNDAATRARIKSYELAFRMQTAVPDIFRFKQEKESIRRLYGFDSEVTRPFAEKCLAARRLVESGVRFVQVYHGGKGGNAWDAHKDVKKNHGELCPKVDQPIAALLKDLKQRGMLEETMVVWVTEFGRTPAAQGGTGRDHHPFGFSVWMAGGGIKGGIAHGSTDEIGFHAVENRHYVTDIHATVLQQLGLDPRRLEVPGRKRLEIDFGKPITEIIG